MRFLVTTAISALCAGLAAADFQIYTSLSVTGQLDGTVNSGGGYFLLPGPPSCDDICSHAIFCIDLDDVSHGNGIRCQGCATGGPIEQLEFHHDDIHWTIYKDGYEMLSADDGSVLGQCQADGGDDFARCACGLGNAESGVRLFTCKSDYTHEDLGYWQ